MVAIAPEVEILLRPGDAGILRTARRLQVSRPRPAAIPESIEEALATCPKETLEGLLVVLRLRPSPALFREPGKKLPIPRLKSSSEAEKLSACVEEWFPPQPPA